MKQIIKLISLSVLMLLLSNCNNKSSNSDAVTSYRMVNGLCYNNLNQQVAATSCGNVINSNYFYAANGQCMDRTTNIAVVATLCANSTGALGTQQCLGQYSYYNPTLMTSVTGTCSTTNGVNNCSGYQMTSLTTGQTVTCL